MFADVAVAVGESMFQFQYGTIKCNLATNDAHAWNVSIPIWYD